MPRRFDLPSFPRRVICKSSYKMSPAELSTIYLLKHGEENNNNTWAPALQHARAGHDVQTVARDVRVGAQQPRAVYWQEVDVAELGR